MTHRRPAGRRQAAAARPARRGRPRLVDAADRILDGAVAGAAAEVALERAGRSWRCASFSDGRGHDHAGGAEAALEALRVEERLLHRVQLAVAGEALDGGDLAARRRGRPGTGSCAPARRRPDRAGAAVAGVAALLDAEPAQVAQEGAQALAGPRLRRSALAVDLIAHDAEPPRQFAGGSPRRSSGVMCLRYAGVAVHVVEVERVRDLACDALAQRRPIRQAGETTAGPAARSKR